MRVFNARLIIDYANIQVQPLIGLRIKAFIIDFLLISWAIILFILLSVENVETYINQVIPKICFYVKYLLL